MFEFGQQAVLRFAGNDLRQINELVSKIDKEVAQLNLNPDKHGGMLLRRLSEYL